jgi:hypothetical protein
LPYEMAHFLSCHKKSPLTKQWLFLLIIDIDFIVFHKSSGLNHNPALLANLAIFYDGNWIPNSFWVRLDILKLIALLNMWMRQCK